METQRLLNQNINVEYCKFKVDRFPGDVHPYYEEGFKLINTQNGMELARFRAPIFMDCWINPGGFMNKEEFDDYQNRKDS